MEQMERARQRRVIEQGLDILQDVGLRAGEVNAALHEEPCVVNPLDMIEALRQRIAAWQPPQEGTGHDYVVAYGRLGRLAQGLESTLRLWVDELRALDEAGWVGKQGRD